jgi:hypothetical protein
MSLLTLTSIPFRFTITRTSRLITKHHGTRVPRQRRRSRVLIMATPKTAATNHEQNRCQALMIATGEYWLTDSGTEKTAWPDRGARETEVPRYCN